MSHSQFPEFPASQSQDAVPGFWKLAPGRALSLQPRQPGLLRVAQGQVWATLDAEHQGAGNELGDYFLGAGEHLTVRPGQHVVLEPLAQPQPQAVFFEWTPSPVRAQASATQDSDVVTEPLRDLGQALGLVAMALLHLGAGMLAYARQMAWGRPVVQAPQHCS